MVQEKQDQRTNPFQVGGLGLILMLIGYTGIAHLGGLAAEAEAEVAARLQTARDKTNVNPASAQDKDTLDKVSRYYRTRLNWFRAARLGFFVGLGLVVSALVIWYRQAQEPEVQPDPNPDSANVSDVPGPPLLP